MKKRILPSFFFSCYNLPHMHKTFFHIFLFLSLLFISATPLKRATLLNSLDPLSLCEHLAFYRLYADTNEGQTAYKKTLKLLQCHLSHPEHIPSHSLYSLLNIFSCDAQSYTPLLEKDLLQSINRLREPLSHHRLQGHEITTEEELLSLSDQEIDIARAVLVAQGNLNLEQIESYEAILDLMALQILARLPPSATAMEIITTINHFLFQEMEFQFPSLSKFEKEIDRFTFLGPVMDARRGVCLGISILYLALAQRLGLSLEIITPPGHIYLRFKDMGAQINIETTVRGIHVDDSFYLNINTRSLPMRTLKEVVGLAYFNRASLYWEKKEFENCLNCYKQAEKYMAQDHQLQELIALCSILVGKEEEGREILTKLLSQTPAHLVAKDPLAAEYLEGKINKEGLPLLLCPCEEQREVLSQRAKQLEQLSQTYPLCCTLYLQQASTLLKLGRQGEALEALKRYHTLDPNCPMVEYLMAQLCIERVNFPKAWEHLNKCEMLTGIRGHHPKALKQLHRVLTLFCPPSTLRSACLK